MKQSEWKENDTIDKSVWLKAIPNVQVLISEMTAQLGEAKGGRYSRPTRIITSWKFQAKSKDIGITMTQIWSGGLECPH